MIPAYIELARVYAALNKHDEAVRAIQQCLSYQPDCSIALLTLAKVTNLVLPPYMCLTVVCTGGGWQICHS